MDAGGLYHRLFAGIRRVIPEPRQLLGIGYSCVCMGIYTVLFRGVAAHKMDFLPRQKCKAKAIENENARLLMIKPRKGLYFTLLSRPIEA